MAKRQQTHHRISASGQKEVRIQDILGQVNLEGGLPTTYANHAQIALTQHELMLDLYLLGPARGRPGEMEGQFVQRIILSRAQAKGLATAIANVVANYEADQGESLPNLRAHDPNDKIEIWPS